MSGSSLYFDHSANRETPFFKVVVDAVYSIVLKTGKRDRKEFLLL